MQRFLKTRIPVLGILALTLLTAHGDESDTLSRWPQHEFDFARMVYKLNSYLPGNGDAFTDYPEAEYFFSLGVGRLTRVDLGREGVNFRLDDDILFNYPWLYAVEVGNWFLDDHDAARLREYLLRGGFLMVDDFHGSRQWVGFLDSMSRVFPDRPIVEIEDGNEILHVVYDVDDRIQIPGIVSIGCFSGGFGGRGGVGYEADGRVPHWRGIYDDDGRLMVVINHNMDLGDAWEHADTPCYPQEMTTLALHFAVNYVIYSMTH
jgi:hypothetical protein